MIIRLIAALLLLTLAHTGASAQVEPRCGTPGKPAAVSPGVQVETPYGWMLAWLCADGSVESSVITKTPSLDPLEVARLHALAEPLLAPHRVAVKRWQVAPNGTSATRPAYELIDGVLKLSATRAPVLTDGKPTPCSVALVKHVVGSTTYAEVPGLASPPVRLLAVCRLV